MTDAELQHFVREWTRTLLVGDARGAAALRSEGYRFTAPDGKEIDAEAELQMARSHDFELQKMVPRDLAADLRDDGVRVRFDVEIAGKRGGRRLRGRYRQFIFCRRVGEGWRADRASVQTIEEITSSPLPSLARRLKRLARRTARRLGVPDIRRRSQARTFGAFAYLPYLEGENYVIPATAAPASGELPVPPKALWTDAFYTKHGAAQVAAMLETAEASGLSFARGDRILDLGCGSGRLIRELAPLADRCEIWGLDISAPHILWCRQNLSPPFHFATCTKVPHLPFADASFRFVFCSSLFTHIDDLADAWLLEIRRILRPDGRLFATFHDEGTISRLEEGGYGASAIAQGFRESPTYQAAVRDGFATFSIGRDSDSQVFHHSDWIARLASPAFDIVAVRGEAYHYQTGYLMAPRLPRRDPQ